MLLFTEHKLTVDSKCYLSMSLENLFIKSSYRRAYVYSNKDQEENLIRKRFAEIQFVRSS